VNVVEAYVPARDEWGALPSLPVPVCGYGLVEMDGKAYLFGGRQRRDEPQSVSAGVWSLDPDATSWTVEAEMPLPRSDLAAVVDWRGEVHVLGGRDRQDELTTSHWIYNPTRSDRPWRESDPLPEGRAGLSAFSFTHRLYVVGGGWDRKVDALVWEPGGDWRWEPDLLPNPRGPAGIPVPQRDAGLATVDGGATIVLAGGRSADGRLLDGHLRIKLERLFFP
jgi:hypothetical protein